MSGAKLSYRQDPELLGNVPEAWKARRQWALARLEQGSGQTTLSLVPYAPDGSKASTTDPKTWTSFTDAMMALQRDPPVDGLLYMFTADDPHFIIKLVGCLNDDGHRAAVDPS